MESKENLIRIVLVVLLFYSIVSVAGVEAELTQSRQQLTQLQQELVAQQTINAQLQEKIAHERDPEELQQLARERLGLVLPGEKLFYFSSDREG